MLHHIPLDHAHEHCQCSNESAATVHQEDLFAGRTVMGSADSANFLGFNVGNQFWGMPLPIDSSTLEEH